MYHRFFETLGMKDVLHNVIMIIKWNFQLPKPIIQAIKSLADSFFDDERSASLFSVNNYSKKLDDSDTN